MYLRTLATYLNESRSYSPAYLCCFKFERSYSPISCSDKPVTTRLLLRNEFIVLAPRALRALVPRTINSLRNRSRLVTITYVTVHTKWVIFTHLTEIQMREYDISGVFDKVLTYYVATSKSERKVFPLSSYIMFLLQKGEAQKQP